MRLRVARKILENEDSFETYPKATYDRAWRRVFRKIKISIRHIKESCLN